MRVYRAVGIALVVQANLVLTACTPEAITALTSVASVIVQPDTLDIDVGSNAALSAAGYNAYGFPMLGLPATWSSADVAIAQVTESGGVAGVEAGVTTITATINGKTGRSTIRVRRPVATVTVTPTAPTVTEGQTVQLTSTLRSANGTVITGRTVAWSSSSSAVATVSATGLVTAVMPGAAVITATSEGKSGSATVTVNATPVATVTVTPTSAAISVGGTTLLTATARDANGIVLSGRTAAWSTSNTAVATVTAGGVVTAVAVGAATVTAVVEGMSGSSSVTVAAAAVDACDPEYVVPAQPALPGGIDVTVDRMTTGCGTVLVSSGIPLAPGALTATQASQLRLFVGGQEQALYVEPLQGTHPGGSLRTVLVQFNYSLVAGKPVPGQLVLGQARGTSDIAKPSASRSSPVALVLPTRPDYLVSTQLVGPTIPVAAASALSATHTKYESDFVTFANKHWTLEGSSWEGNYYDRALIYYAWWIRSGKVEYWKRATAILLDYRTDYLEANDYNSSAHWQQIEGVELHYLLTGDEASRTAVGRVADVFNVAYYMDNLSDLTAEMDNRIQARTLMALLTAWKLKAESRAGANWATLLPKALTDILSTQDAGGAYRFVQVQCGHNHPYMVGLLNDALIKYHTYFNADARILPAIQKSDDYMWTNDWIAAEQAFIYLDGPCPGTGNDPAPDLNNLIVNGFAWVYQQTRNTVYQDRADQIFTGGVYNAWLDGSKQFNQEYTSSYRYLAYRQ